MSRPHLTKGLKVFKTPEGAKLAILVRSTNRGMSPFIEARTLRKQKNLLRRGVYIDINCIRLKNII